MLEEGQSHEKAVLKGQKIEVGERTSWKEVCSGVEEKTEWRHMKTRGRKEQGIKRGSEEEWW